MVRVGLANGHLHMPRWFIRLGTRSDSRILQRMLMVSTDIPTGTTSWRPESWLLPGRRRNVRSSKPEMDLLRSESCAAARRGGH